LQLTNYHPSFRFFCQAANFEDNKLISACVGLENQTPERLLNSTINLLKSKVQQGDVSACDQCIQLFIANHDTLKLSKSSYNTYLLALLGKLKTDKKSFGPSRFAVFQQCTDILKIMSLDESINPSRNTYNTVISILAECTNSYCRSEDAQHDTFFNEICQIGNRLMDEMKHGDKKKNISPNKLSFNLLILSLEPLVKTLFQIDTISLKYSIPIFFLYKLLNMSFVLMIFFFVQLISFSIFSFVL